MSSTAIHVVTASFDRLALALIYALAISALWLAPSSSPNETARRNGLLGVTLVITLFAAGVELWMRTAAMADVTPLRAWSFIPRVLGHSDFGVYWQERMVAWGVMVVMTLWVWRKGWSAISSTTLLVAALVTALLQSVTSHAGEDGMFSVENLMNWIHLVSTSLWGGTVVFYALLFLPALRNGDASVQVSSAAERLSSLAATALVVVLLSGLYNTWHQLATISDLWSTDYGKALLIKLGLVGVMMTIGALNRFLWVPQLVAWPGGSGSQWGRPSDRFLRVLRIDSLVFVAVLVAASVLGTESPPAHVG